MDNRILVWQGKKAIHKKEKELKRLTYADLEKELGSSPMSPATARQAMFLEEMKESITISPFEVKQHFIERCEFDNAQKADKLQTDNPKQTARKVRAELSFFGLSFLEGFLDFYGIKVNRALSRYEGRLSVIQEQQLDTGERKASVCQVVKSELKKISEHKTMEEAQKKVQGLSQEHKISGGLRHEIQQPDS